ncbi:MAG: glutamate--cysteine ligase [Sandaracinaceae bacterium]|nr:glutamate--cysteine ligase [Sandaracinaceae bacterium]
MLHQIAENFLNNRDKIEAFFAEKSKGLVPPLYLSCDIRNSGHKIGVVDTNLFPAGFNNLCNSYSRLTGFALKAYFETYLPEVRNVLVLVEEHTRNRFYLENVLRLLGLLEEAGIKSRAVYAGEEIAEPSFEADLGQGKVLRMERLQVREGRPYAGDFAGDWILSNNDFSQGLPQALTGLEGRISPPPGLGWHRRRKSGHFSRLQGLIQEFAARLEIDPWLLNCEFTTVDEVELGENGVPVHVAETAEGALATWTTAASGGQPVRLRPIDRDGRARGPTRDVPAEGALYGLLARSTPDGGAVLAWEEYHFRGDPEWRLRMQSVRPDGTARAAPSTVRIDGHAETWDLLVDPSGSRALLLVSYDGNAVDALPLRCAR